MTTIASDGKTVAADGLSTFIDERVNHDYRKITLFEHDKLFGFTGKEAIFKPAIVWYLGGADPDKIPKAKDWGLYVFTLQGVDRFTDESPYADRFPYPCAFGSGRDYAMGAMLAGASPKKAVEIAALLDVYTGGVILELPVPDGRSIVAKDGDRYQIVKRAIDELPDECKRIA